VVVCNYEPGTNAARPRAGRATASRIYTRGGDKGETGLGDGTRVRKDSPRMDGLGTLDELSASLGLARAALAGTAADALATVVRRIQRELGQLCAEVAAAPDAPARIGADHVAALEHDMDAWSKGLPALHGFVLPGGAPAAAQLHMARAICRRAERALVHLTTETVGEHVIPYLNRLSDALFVAARHANHLLGQPDE
jgi:cob(I)alamin adenosyltransferase